MKRILKKWLTKEFWASSFDKESRQYEAIAEAACQVTDRATWEKIVYDKIGKSVPTHEQIIQFAHEALGMVRLAFLLAKAA